MTEENSNKLGKPILSFFLKYEHKRIVLNISQDFNLQKCFQAKSFTRVFFADLVSFSQNPSFLMPLNVKYKGKCFQGCVSFSLQLHYADLHMNC